MSDEMKFEYDVKRLVGTKGHEHTDVHKTVKDANGYEDAFRKARMRDEEGNELSAVDVIGFEDHVDFVIGEPSGGKSEIWRITRQHFPGPVDFKMRDPEK